MASQMQPNQQGPKDDKFKRSVCSTDGVLAYFKNNLRETISFVLLIVGILLMPFEPIYGGTLVGLIAGIYFGDDIILFIKNWKNASCCRCDSPEGARRVVGLGVAITILITTPAIYLGIAISVGIKQLFASQMGSK